MSANSVFIYSNKETNYRFNDSHPFNQQRLALTLDLLRKAGAIPDSALREPESAGENDLLTVHNQEFIAAVQALSEPNPSAEWVSRARSYGLDTEDTPFFPRMHEITLSIVGGSIRAVDEVMSGRAPHALHLGGGLHHALPGKAAGFCIYNDAAVAIEHAKRLYSARVLYIDTDVHHGDGVQWTFYTDPQVCKLSIHETGKYLFPGTGGVAERGEGEGFGTSVNIPLEPYTEDASWLECFETVLNRTIASFKPDLIVSQHGCDAHAFDPLAHIQCSMEVYRAMPRIIHRLAHEHCDGRWVALGGGGYDIWRVVPRAWSLLWLVMSDHPLIRELELSPQLQLPESWLAKWQPYSSETLPATWLDPVEEWAPMPRRQEITEANRRVMELAMQYLG